jgi:toxin ParE1/3/4
LTQIKRISEFPELGRIVPEIEVESIREIFIYSYRLIYQVLENNILIVAVIHGKRILDLTDRM